MKRIISLIITFLMATFILSGCAKATAQETPAADSKISIVCTTFPQYDWVRQILGERSDNVNLTLLLDSGIDLHSYQPTVDDIVEISACDLFIYVGGESDKWVEDALVEATNPDMIVINLLDELGNAAKTEEVIEGMEENHDHDHDHEEHDDIHQEETEYDEHVWLSLKNAQVFSAVIENALSSLDTGNAKEYQKNLAAYTEKLSALDGEYQATATAAPLKTLLFGDRFPFRYLVDDYDLKYYAAFVGCSAETEASFETVAFLTAKVDELGLNTIMVTESADQSIAKAIINNTTGKNQKILALDAMQSVTAADVQAGITYISIMEDNLEVLKEALE